MVIRGVGNRAQVSAEEFFYFGMLLLAGVSQNTGFPQYRHHHHQLLRLRQKFDQSQIEEFVNWVRCRE